MKTLKLKAERFFEIDHKIKEQDACCKNLHLFKQFKLNDNKIVFTARFLSFVNFSLFVLFSLFCFLTYFEFFDESLFQSIKSFYVYIFIIQIFSFFLSFSVVSLLELLSELNPLKDYFPFKKYYHLVLSFFPWFAAPVIFVMSHFVFHKFFYNKKKLSFENETLKLKTLKKEYKDLFDINNKKYLKKKEIE